MGAPPAIEEEVASLLSPPSAPENERDTQREKHSTQLWALEKMKKGMVYVYSHQQASQQRYE